MIGMAEDLDSLLPPKTWDDLRKVERELKAPVEADYAAAVGPMRRRMAQGIADIERDYAARLKDAKAQLRAAQRVYADEAAALSKWRKASTEALEREYESTRRPWGVDRRQKMKPIEAWYRQQADRIFREQHPEGQA